MAAGHCLSWLDRASVGLCAGASAGALAFKLEIVRTHGASLERARGCVNRKEPTGAARLRTPTVPLALRLAAPLPVCPGRGHLKAPERAHSSHVQWHAAPPAPKRSRAGGVGGTGHHGIFFSGPSRRLPRDRCSLAYGAGSGIQVARPVDWQPPGSRALWVGPSLKLLPAALVSVGQSCQCGLLAAWNYECSKSLYRQRQDSGAASGTGKLRSEPSPG